MPTLPARRHFLPARGLDECSTHELGHNALRGSFEMAVDVIPINEFWIGGNAQYAGAIDPFIAKWNFTGGKTVSPYLAAVGGVVFSPSNLAAGRYLAGEFHQRRRVGSAVVSPRRARTRSTSP